MISIKHPSPICKRSQKVKVLPPTRTKATLLSPPSPTSKKRSNKGMGKNKTGKFDWGKIEGYIKSTVAKNASSHPQLALPWPEKPDPAFKNLFKTVFFDPSPDGLLNFQWPSASLANCTHNWNKTTSIESTMGARKKADSTSATGHMTPLASTKKPAPRTPFTAGKTPPVGLVKATRELMWETMHSYWHDSKKNLRLTFWVLLPGGCRAQDVNVSIAPDEGSINIKHIRPSCFFDAAPPLSGASE